MAKKKRSAPKKSAPVSASSDLVNYFKTKLEAEWGPYDLKRAFDADQQNLIIIDTRKADAYAEAHIPQALNIPTDQLESFLDELPKTKHIVTYCWNITCHLATRAALLLAQKGYRVHELAGGIENWKEAGLPVASAAEQETALN